MKKFPTYLAPVEKEGDRASDVELVAEHHAGEPHAPEQRLTLKSLHDSYFHVVFRAARRLGVPSAKLDDVCQEVFLVAHRKLPEFDGTAARPWLLSITRRVASDVRRAEARERGRLASCLQLLGLGTEEVPEPNLDGEGLIQYLLSTLSLEHREMVVLCILEESSVVEVSEILGINVNTAYTRLRVAKHELRLSYEKYQRLTEAP